ncbi:MAG: hypothetical protein ACAI38_10515 [Myxococcota bacterium]
MTKIGDGRPQVGNTQPGQADRAEKTDAKTTETSAKGAGAEKVMDSFVKANIAQGLAGIATKNRPNVGPIQFTNQQLAQVAEQFAILLRKNPSADRKARARMFAQCIIRGKKFGKIFDQADERELETLYDAIASQLDGVPVLAQLVDEVTDWTLRSPVQR